MKMNPLITYIYGGPLQSFELYK